MHAQPADPLIILSTDGVPRPERYAFWARSVFDYFQLDPLPPEEALAFEGRIVTLTCERGAIHHYSSSAVSGRRTRSHLHTHTGDEIGIGYMIDGHAVYEPERGPPIEARPREFFCFDGARPSRLTLTRNRQLHFALPRATVIEAAGGRVPSPQAIAQALNRSPLAVYLLHQLRRLTRDAPRLTVPQRIVMLDATLALAKSVLCACLQEGPQAPGEPGLYARACEYMNRHLHVCGLSAAHIAAALHCSRAHLYRVFAEHGMTVADRLRELRMRRARQLLHAEPDLDVGTIAWRCGYADASSFGKAFKRRFGLSPLEWRACVRRAPLPAEALLED